MPPRSQGVERSLQGGERIQSALKFFRYLEIRGLFELDFQAGFFDFDGFVNIGFQGLFHFVYCGVYFLEFFSVLRAEERSVCRMGDVHQELFVKVGMHHLHLLANDLAGRRINELDWVGNVAFLTHADSVNFDTQFGRRLCRGNGRYVAEIVAAVGQQNDDLAFGR